MKRKTPLVLAACLTAGLLTACTGEPEEPEEPICVHMATREPVSGDMCYSAPYWYEWVGEDDPDFDVIKGRKPATVVKPVVPQVKPPVVVKPPAPRRK